MTDRQGPVLETPKGLDLNLQLLDRLCGGDGRRDAILKRLDLVLSEFFDLAQFIIAQNQRGDLGLSRPASDTRLGQLDLQSFPTSLEGLVNRRR